jgi:general secretion pathway protein G
MRKGVCMKAQGQGGFTLIEVVVVAAIIAILAGILVPIIFKEVDEARITRAAADVRSISTAMLIFKKDTGQWPVMDATCNPTVTLLTGDGKVPANLAAMGYQTAVTGLYDDHLSTNANGCYNNWKGPYMAKVNADPWGNAYVTNADGFSIQNRELWILSAGPNGVIDTPVPNLAGANLIGDDVGLRLR